FGWVHKGLRAAGRKWQLAPRELLEQLRAWRPPEPAALRLIPARQLRHMNSQFPSQAPPLRAADGPALLMHPEDAAAAGVWDGGSVVLQSAHGELVAVARVDARIERGAVCVPHGYAGWNVNRLMSTADVDVLSGMATLSGTPVAVRARPRSSG